MAQLIQNHPWHQTVLGPMGQWPAELIVTVANLLNSRFPMYLMWGQDLIQFYNDDYRPSLGASGKHPQLLGKPARESWMEVWDMVGPMIENVRSTGANTWMENTRIPVFRNGKMETSYWTFSYSPVYLLDGTIGGVLSVCTENTRHVDHLAELANTQKRLQKLIELTPLAMAVLEGEDLIVRVANDAMLDVWQQPQENVMNKRLLDFQPEIADQPFPRLLQKVLETGITHEEKGIVANLTNAQGTRSLYLDLTYQRFVSEDGRPNSILASVLNRTAEYEALHRLAESEANLRNIIMQAPVAMCIFEGEDHVLSIANDKMLELMGRSREELLSRPIFEALPEVANTGLDVPMKEVLRTGQTFRANEMEVRLQRPNGLENVYVSFVYEPYFSNNGQSAGVMTVALDVTDQVLARHKIEEVVRTRTLELSEANHQLQRTNQELEEFAYIASHDLQEPLRKVSTFGDMLEKSIDAPTPKTLMYLGRMKSAVQRMQTLIRDVLNYSQLSSRETSFERIDLNAIVANVQTDLELLTEQTQATIQADDLPPVEAVHLQMHQLFYNLLSNSLKFRDVQRLPEIRITAAVIPGTEAMAMAPQLHPQHSYLHLQVADNGIGFDQEYGQQIFTIFKRLHGNEEFAGTGIGLALCKKIIQNHRGHIYAEGVLGQGARFHLILPLHQPLERQA